MAPVSATPKVIPGLYRYPTSSGELANDDLTVVRIGLG